MERNALERQFTAASLLRFALPNIVMMVFLSLYTIVDGMFISRYVGTLALSAVNMSYPLSSLQLAMGIMLGTGGSAVIARELGEGKTDQARQDFTFVVAAAAAAGTVCALAGNAVLPWLLELLGTSAAQMPYCLPYTRILLWFAPGMFLQTVFQVLFVTAGRPAWALRPRRWAASPIWCWTPSSWALWAGASPAPPVATGIGYCVPAVTGLVYFSLEKRRPCALPVLRPGGGCWRAPAATALPRWSATSPWQ